MNEGLTHSLIIAKALLDQATRQIKSGDRYLGTAGLMFLQDGLEIIFVALLIDEGTKESAKKAIERRSFDELMGDLNAQGIHIPRTGHLSLLNKQRVQAKHYGLIVDSESAHAYLQSAELAIDTLLKAKIGKGLRDVFLQDLLAEGPAKEFLKDAECHIDAGEWREALLSIRKAIFVEIEFEYDISAYASRNSATSGMFNPNLFAGLKAPPIAKSIDWITLNVHTPTHFIQIDYNSLRTDALRWGVSHAELENILRLTPRVFRYPGTEFWHHDIPSSIASIGLNEEDSRYCLDRAIHILRRLQEYRSSHKTKWTNQLPTLTAPVGTSIHLHAATDSQIVALVTPGWTYTVLSESTGFDGQSYYFVAARDSKLLYSTWNGYIPVKNGTVVPPVISNPYSLI